MIASGTRDLGSPGERCLLRTADPVTVSISATSKNASADGVAITCTVQPRSTAWLTSVPTSAAGPAPDTTTDSTPFLRAITTSIGTVRPVVFRRHAAIQAGHKPGLRPPAAARSNRLLRKEGGAITPPSLRNAPNLR